MKWSDMLIVAGVYVAAVCVAAIAMRWIGQIEPAIAMIVGAATGTLAGSYLYSRRAEKMAGLAVKARLGTMMGLLCLGLSLGVHLAWGWMSADPHATITMSVAGTFVFPFILFHTMELIFVRRGESHYKFK